MAAAYRGVVGGIEDSADPMVLVGGGGGDGGGIEGACGDVAEDAEQKEHVEDLPCG